MPAADIIHNAVKNALIKDGWTITADPYRIEYEEIDLFADLAAERPIAAERLGSIRNLPELPGTDGPGAETLSGDKRSGA